MKIASVLRTAAATVALGGLVLSATGNASAQTPPAGEGDPVVATVNGTEIRRSEVDRLIATLPPQVQMMPPQMILPAVIDQIVNAKLVALEGYEQNLQDAPEAKQRLKQAEERIVQELYLTRELEKRLTDERLQEAYKEYLAENPPQEEVKASHILVETEEEAKKIIEELGKGGDFAQIAREKSKDPGAAARGGDLGYFTKDQMVEPFAEAAFGMEPGAVSEQPVQTQFGWHIIKVEDKRQTTPPSFEEAKDQLKAEMSETLITEIVEGLKADAKIDIKPLAEAAPAESAPAGQNAGQPKKQ